MTNVYLELDERKAKFFEYSKEPKEGFTKHEPENGKVSYRKYHDEGVKGVYKFLNEREEEFKNGKVKKLSIALDNGDTRYYIKMNILNQNKSMNQFVEQLIPILPNMKQGESYRLYPYEMETTYTDKAGQEKTGKNKGISVAYWDLASNEKGDKVAKAHSFAKDGDIPQAVWEEVEEMGEIKKVRNDRDRKNFLYDILKKNLTPYTPNETQGGAPAPKAETPAPAAQAQPAIETFADDEHDDLPF